MNFFLGCVGIAQVTRILMYQRGLKNGTIGQIAKEDTEEMAGAAAEVSKDASTKVKDIVGS